MPQMKRGFFQRDMDDRPSKKNRSEVHKKAEPSLRKSIVTDPHKSDNLELLANSLIYETALQDGLDELATGLIVLESRVQGAWPIHDLVVCFITNLLISLGSFAGLADALVARIVQARYVNCICGLCSHVVRD